MRLLIALAVSLLAAGCAVPPRPIVQPFADGRQWVLEHDLDYRLLDSEHVVHVPRGFVTDFASVPRIAWPIMSPTGPLGRAGVVHDFLYWDQGCKSREVADKIMLLAMIESDVGPLQQTLVYGTLRSAGSSAWDGNAVERAEGKPRNIPEDYRKTWATPQWLNKNWPEFQSFLYSNGVRPLPQTTPTYCSAVDELLDKASCSWWRRLTWRCS